MVPETGLRSGPAVVVKRADRALSGRMARRSAVRAAADAADLSLGVLLLLLLLSLPSASVPALVLSVGTSMAKSAMIWSAVLRLSLDLSGARGLI